MNIGVKLVLAFGIDKIIVAEALRAVCHGLKNSDNFIFATLRKGIKLNGLVFLIEALGLVILQSPEHFAALNVMTVNNKVIAARKVAVFLNIRCTQVAVFLFKIALQIVVRLIRCLHHGIIEGRAGYGKPADHIRVFQIQFSVFREDIFFLCQGNFWGVSVLCLCLLYDFGNILKGFGLFSFVGIMVVNVIAAKSRRT